MSRKKANLCPQVLTGNCWKPSPVALGVLRHLEYIDARRRLARESKEEAPSELMEPAPKSLGFKGQKTGADESVPAVCREDLYLICFDYVWSRR
jgi:hypothetical protein